MKKIVDSADAIFPKSTFEGSAWGWFGVNLLVFLGSVFSLGIAIPWLYCFRQRYIVSHTVYNGYRMYFDGTGGQLIGKSILWSFLTIITLGIYRPWIKLKKRKWIATHTHFICVRNGVSNFNGSLFQFTWIRVTSNLLSFITLGIASFWMHCRKERYFAKHTIIDGQRLSFDGTGMQYLGKKIVWCLLTVLTLGIYSFCLVVRSRKWTVSHTTIENPEAICVDGELVDAYAREQAHLAELRAMPEWQQSLTLFIMSLPMFQVFPVSLILLPISMRKAKKAERFKLRKAAIVAFSIIGGFYLFVVLFIFFGYLFGYVSFE